MTNPAPATEWGRGSGTGGGDLGPDSSPHTRWWGEPTERLRLLKKWVEAGGTTTVPTLLFLLVPIIMIALVAAGVSIGAHATAVGYWSLFWDWTPMGAALRYWEALRVVEGSWVGAILAPEVRATYTRTAATW